LVRGYEVDPRIADSARLVTVALNLEGARYSTVERRGAFVERLEQQIASAPGVHSVAVTTHLPLGGGFAPELELDGRETPAVLRPVVTALVVTPTYFQTLGVRVVQGRPFNASDGAAGLENAIVNERLARLYFADRNPIGRRLRFSGHDLASNWMTVVGVTANVPQRWESAADDPVVYVPYRGEAPMSAFAIVRGVGDPGVTARLLRQRMRELDPDLPQLDLRTFDEVLAQARFAFAAPSTIFGVIAFVALGFTAISLYGLTAYAVSSRRREIGVRLALGAQALQIHWLVVRQVVTPVTVGAGVGIPGAAAIGLALQGAIPEIDGTDPITLIIVLSVAFIACIAAGAGPSWRATHIDPAITLRTE
jgi:putative ABC transport system permease protein